ncbi:hypothetical protein FB451DRAFT_471253 [Mycena latifolia]|nr:hypothetical protein FB451DRAFT_471253 [Mycena latifolia]
MSIPTASVLHLPQDVVAEMLSSHCGPATLRQLRLVSRPLRDFLDENPFIWRAARRRVLFDVPLPLTGPSEVALADLMFGNIKCFSCGELTNVMPHSFALKIKLCSPSCRYIILENGLELNDRASIIPPCEPRLTQCRTLPIALPYLEGSADSPWYKTAMVNSAWADFFAQSKATSGVSPRPLEVAPGSAVTNPALPHWMKTAEEFLRCSHAYREAKKVVDAQHESL